MPQLRRLRKNLWTLDLRGTQVTDAGLVDLARLKNLLWLDLSDHITDAGLPKLESLANLSHLHLAKSKVTAEGVQKLKKALPKCEIEYEKRKPLMNADGPRLP
jgi:Leucine-rich repeat (LRR) protein